MDPVVRSIHLTYEDLPVKLWKLLFRNLLYIDVFSKKKNQFQIPHG